MKSSSPDEIDNLEADFIPHGRAGECVMETPVEPIHEIHLKDDLADSLVNLPRDQDVSGEEENKQSFLLNSQSAPHNKESKEMLNEDEDAEESSAGHRIVICDDQVKRLVCIKQIQFFKRNHKYLLCIKLG